MNGSMSKWDFWSSGKMKYDDRSKIMAGDYYGTGQPPKEGKLRESYFQGKSSKGKSSKPPKKIA